MVTATNKEQTMEQQLAAAQKVIAGMKAKEARLEAELDDSAYQDVKAGRGGSAAVETGDTHSSQTGNRWVVLRLPMVVGQTTNDGKKWLLSTTRGAKPFTAELDGREVTLSVSVNCTMAKD